MATLKELKLDEKTLVIFTSDNGGVGGTSAPFRGGKGSIFEGGMREPCIMRWPGRIPAGTTCNQIAGNIDMLPHLCKNHRHRAAAGSRARWTRHHLAHVQGRRSARARHAFLYFTRASKLGAIRQGDWKLFLADQQNPRFEKSAAKADVRDGTLFRSRQGSLRNHGRCRRSCGHRRQAPRRLSAEA